jgi:CubicO group peptidase (beta-lactamase class C family)
VVLALLSVAAPGHSQTPEPPATEAPGAGESIAWPTEGWQVRPLDEATRSRPAFQELQNYLFPPDFDEQARSGVRTDGIVVIQGDALVYERYGRGYSAEMAHPAWSVTKALVDALYGVAVQDGLLAIDDPVAARSDLLAADGRDAITFRHLLAMTSGSTFARRTSGHHCARRGSRCSTPAAAATWRGLPPSTRGRIRPAARLPTPAATACC